MRSCTLLARLLLSMVVVLLLPSVLVAQTNNKQYTENKADLGLRADARIDPSTLAMSLEIPLGGAPGRAGTSVSSVLRYSSKQWRMNYAATFKAGASLHTWTRIKFSEDAMAGWTSSLDAPWIEYTGRNQRFDCSNGSPMSDDPDAVYDDVCFIARIHLHLPDGSSHELRKSDTPQVFVITNPQPDFTGTFFSTDGARMRFDSDAGVLYTPDGGRYFFGAEQFGARYNHQELSWRWATQYIDRNGNTLSYSLASVTDTLGRVYPNPLASNPTVQDQSYSVPGFNGQSLTYTLRWRNLADALSPQQQLSYTSNLECLGANQYSDHQTEPRLYQSTGGFSHICRDTSIFNPVVLAEVVLPNGQSYQLKYDSFGEIDKIIYPTGGYERFVYGKVTQLARTTWPYGETNRGVVDRWFSPSGSGSDETPTHSNYLSTAVTSTQKITITPPDGNGHTERLMYASGTGIPASYGFDNPLAGMTYDEQVFDSAGQMRQRTLTEWATEIPSGSTHPRNPRVTRTTSLILVPGGNALATSTTMEYDSDSNVIATRQYGYVSVDSTTAQSGAISSIPLGPGSPPTPLRTEETTYLVNDTNIDSTVRSNYRARNLIGLPSSSRVKDSSGTIVAQSSVSYDEATFPLTPPYASVNAWTDPGVGVVRGNATTMKSWLNTNNTWLESHMQYDQCGSVRKTWDARDTGLTNPSQISYQDVFSDGPHNNTYAFPTSITTAVPDSSGVYGSNLAFTTTNIYDFNTGKVVSMTDPNAKTTTYDYAEALNRLKQVTKPDAGRVRYYYSPALGDLYVQVLMDEDASRSIETRQYFDGLGRAIRGFLYDGTPSTPWLVTDTYYDNMGRVSQVSNPYRVGSPGSSVPASCSACTTNAYDSLGRVVSVTTPDNAQVTTSYDLLTSGTTLGTTVLVTDQALKKRRSLTDSLGRLVRVDEPDVNGNLGDVSSPVQPTSYSYDVLGNLHLVTQGAQQRFFMYDSLSRLLRARNPETAVNANLPALTDPITGNGQWSIAYTYDNNGNLTQKTDARGVVSSYGYDALNRNKTIDYSDTTNVSPDVTRVYDGATSGKGRLWDSYAGGTASVGSNVEHTKVTAYDALGRPLSQLQEFKTSGVWSSSYITQRNYNLAGSVTLQIYPSNHSVTYNYDQAGRLGDKDSQNLAFTGSLGDGVTRTYSRGISYSPFGSIAQEQFGTDTAIYNKLAYNSRGQLAEIKESTAPNDSSWNRGKFINWYSLQCGGMACNATDNNGNLRKQENFIPNNEQNTSSTSWYQQFDYDNLNRLQRAHEYTGNTSLDWQQEYVYDRYGNRRIEQDVTKTYGSGINKKDFTANVNNDNRLGVPAGQTGTMVYDNAGNLTSDTYSGGAVTRAYDEENHMTSEMQANSFVAGSYTYNADGQRVRRTVGGQPSAVTTWQVYGFDGELLAEYPANADCLYPQKEYGYRNGQLLITAEAAARANVASASNGATATAQNYTADGVYAGLHFQPTYANDGLRYTTANGDHYWRDEHGLSSWLQVDFNGAKSIDEVDVYTMRDDYATQADPGATQTFANYGVSGFTLQYWTGSAWAPIPNCTISGNNLVWRKLNFTAVTTSKIRVLANTAVDGIARLAEVEAWGTAARANVALGATTTAQNYTADGVYAGMHFQPTYATDGVRHTSTDGASYWRDEHGLSSWLQVDFNGSKTIDEVDVYTMGDYPFYTTQADPTATQTFTQVQGATAYNVQYWTGSAWQTVMGGSVSGNNLVWTKLTFTAVTTSKMRVVVNACADNVARIVELEAWGTAAGASTSSINWLVTDQLGTPRMVFDKSGSLATTKRHDYQPFGEEISGGTGGRTPAQGYVAADGVRQKFTEKERDTETGLDYFGARYYASTQGRFSSPDPIPVTKESFLNPQRWNLYAYVNNNPLASVDPNGGDGQSKGGDKVVSVFLDLTIELGHRITTVQGKVVRDVPNVSNWEATTAGAPKDYTLKLYGEPQILGEKVSPEKVTNQAFDSSLENSTAVIYIGHGVQIMETNDEPLQIPFKQEAIKLSGTLYTPNGTGKVDGGIGFSGPKPTVTASVVASFSCDSDRTGSSYFNFAGKNQFMVTVNSGADGVTDSPTLEKAANAFAKTYMATGNVENAVKAANKVIAKNPGKNQENVGDQVVLRKVD